MYNNNKILCTICARGGSKGVKGKNFKLINGKPLIAYTIEKYRLFVMPLSSRKNIITMNMIF